MNKRGRLNKKAQNQISFGMIFSIILIIIFIAFAIYAIKIFLDTQRIAQVQSFKNDLQVDIDNMWMGPGGDKEKEYFIPKNIDQVCFIDYEFYNIYFKPEGKYDGKELENIDITNTIRTSTSRPKELCIDTENGKISLLLKKDYNENLVTIAK
jgi:hypothetical protein